MRYLMIIAIYLSACLVPFAGSQSSAQSVDKTFKNWPTEFEGIPLTRLPMTDKERGFSQNFPGKIARFTDGSREIIFRYVERSSRKVHPSSDCLRGSGYSVEPKPISRDQNGKLWGCVLAERGGITYKVCERIYDLSGNSWYDVSSWFWSVLLSNSKGPWWAVTVAERV